MSDGPVYSIGASRSRFWNAMHRHSKLIIWLCLTALIFCQWAAAANLCGTRFQFEAQVEVAALAADCHGGAEKHAGGCGASGCDLGQGLNDAAPAPFVAVSFGPDRFELNLRPFVETRAMTTLDRIAAHPPPHVLGQLLI